jgi:hypothetical protein
MLIRYSLVTAVVCSLAVIVAACDDGDETEDASRSCGDQQCSQSTCETQQTCPADCGTCSGASCAPIAGSGSCTNACGNTCDCVSPHELCTADYGDLPGRCIPVGCLQCSTFDACDFTADADGFCANPTCITAPR